MRCQRLTAASVLRHTALIQNGVSVREESGRSQRRVSTLSSSCGAEKSAAVSAMAPRINVQRDMMNDDLICRAAVGLSEFAKPGEMKARGRRE
jgi:hypothetical protein